MAELVIDRSKWRCGGESGANATGLGPTRLKNYEGFMCCLGFAIKNFNENIDFRDFLTRNPVSLPHILKKSTDFKDIFGLVRPTGKILNPNGEKFEDTDLCKDAMEINDDALISNGARESNIKELFEKHGHKVIFEGDYIYPPEAEK